MDWALAIKRNSEALKGIVAALFAMLGLDGEAVVGRIRSPCTGPCCGCSAGRIRHAAPHHHRSPRPGGEASCLASGFASDAGAADRQGRAFPSRLPAFRPTEKLHKAAPPEGPAGCPAHHFLQQRFHGDKPVARTPSRRSRVAARWPGGRRAPQPQAPGPQAGTRGSAAPGPASGPLAGEAREHAKSEVQVAARPGRPPGYRRKPVHLVDEVLIECHGLAFDAMKPDTS